jgi:hypothetical protein
MSAELRNYVEHVGSEYAIAEYEKDLASNRRWQSGETDAIELKELVEGENDILRRIAEILAMGHIEGSNPGDPRPVGDKRDLSGDLFRSLNG